MSNVTELTAAIGQLGPGRVLCLSAGTYTLPARISLGAQRSGAANNFAVIRSRDGLGSVTIDANGAEEAIPFYQTLRRHLPLGRVQGLADQPMDEKDPLRRAKIASALLQVAQVERIDLTPWTSVRFYRSLYSTHPGDRGRPPLSTEFLVEVPTP